MLYAEEKSTCLLVFCPRRAGSGSLFPNMDFPPISPAQVAYMNAFAHWGWLLEISHFQNSNASSFALFFL